MTRKWSSAEQQQDHLQARVVELEAQIAVLDTLQAQLLAQRSNAVELLEMTQQMLEHLGASPEVEEEEENLPVMDIAGLTIVDAASVVLREKGLTEARAPDISRWLVERGYREVSAPVVYQALLGATHGKQPKVVRAEGRGLFAFVAQTSISRLDGKSMLEAARILAREHNTREVTAPILTRWFEDEAFTTRLNQRPKRPSVYVALQNAVDRGTIRRGTSRGSFDLFPERDEAKPTLSRASVQSASVEPAPEVVEAPVVVMPEVSVPEPAPTKQVLNFDAEDILNYAAEHQIDVFSAEEAAEWVGCVKPGRVRLMLAQESGAGTLRMESDGTFSIRH